MKKLIFLFLLLLSYTGAEAQTYESLKGKRIAFIGDSYVRNHKEPVERTWHYKFAKKYGMEYFNYGRNGACVTIDRERFGKALCNRYMEMNDTLDYIVIIAGHNDASLLNEIGGIEVYKEKLNVLCEGLINKYPTSKILFFTPWNRPDFANSDFKKVIDATIEVCGNYSIPVFDSARRSNIFAHSEAFRKIYFQGGTGKDTAHLNAKGHDRFFPCAEAFILQYCDR